MAHYDINVNGVKSVLNSTVGEAEELKSCVKDVQPTLYDARLAVYDPKFIEPALVSFENSLIGNAGRVLQRTMVALRAAHDATQAYINANHQMTHTVVAEQQAALGKLPKP